MSHSPILQVHVIIAKHLCCKIYYKGNKEGVGKGTKMI